MKCIDNQATSFLDEEERYIGLTPETYLKSRIEEGDITGREVKQLREVCTSFLFARKRLPLDNQLLQSLGWLVPGSKSTPSQVIELEKCLPNIVSSSQLPQLKREYIDYQCTSFDLHDDIASYWHRVSQVKDPAGDPRYPLLAMLAKAVLIINHSKVDSERLFLRYGLGKTKHRNRLGIAVMNALLTIKVGMQMNCYEFIPSKQLLKKCINPIQTLKSISGQPETEHLDD